MKTNARRLVAVFVLCTLARSAEAQTADPEASPAAKAVFNFIRNLPERREKRVLSGQFLQYAPFASLELPEAIHRASGKWPAYIGIDYINYETQSIDTDVADRVAIEYWKLGGLVELNVCLLDPANPKGGGLRDKGVDLTELLRTGTASHAAWIRELDLISAGLQRLQEAGVVVFWRPCMEMNGDWFWWGGKPPADFIALWRHMFAYFTNVKHLHNLIWIYSPNMGSKVGDYYPGDRYVDLVGLDAYTDHIDPIHIKGFDVLQKIGKPTGFGEYGPHGPSDPPGTYDFRAFGKGLLNNFKQAVFFMSWNEKWSPANNLNAKEFYNDPLIVTRDDLPAGLGR